MKYSSNHKLATVSTDVIVCPLCPQLHLGSAVSGQGHHQGLFLSPLAQKVGQHERREEAELHGVAELKQLQVGSERPLKHGT